jgi:hypothetical protein
VEQGGVVDGLAGRRIVFVVAGEVFGGAVRVAFDLAVRVARVERAEVAICALDGRPFESLSAAATAASPR